MTRAAFITILVVIGSPMIVVGVIAYAMDEALKVREQGRKP